MRKTANFEGILAFNIAQQQGDQYNIFSVSPVWFMFARTSFFFFFSAYIHRGFLEVRLLQCKLFHLCKEYYGTFIIFLSLDTLKLFVHSFYLFVFKFVSFLSFYFSRLLG